MRNLILLRGAPGAGKSTFIKNEGLEQYTICPDIIRTMIQAPICTPEGKLAISQKNDRRVWELVNEIVEERMKRGDFTVIDATFYKSKLIAPFKKLAEKHRYRITIVDFTGVPIDTCKERNRSREAFKVVPEPVIDKMYAAFESDSELKKSYEVIKPEEFGSRFTLMPMKLDPKYTKVVVIGDIHGCYDPLKEYFENKPFNDSTYYVFLGDYIDRGIQNKEVVDFLLSIYEKPNVILLEGNHEAHLRKFAEGDFDSIRGNDFRNDTSIELASTDKKQLRQLCRKFAQLAYIQFGKYIIVCTHGGITSKPNYFMSTQSLIKGVGEYGDIEQVYETFINTHGDPLIYNVMQCHGHRNIPRLPIVPTAGIFNLEGNVEYGGDLRIAEFHLSGPCEGISIKNNTYSPERMGNASSEVVASMTDKEVIEALDHSAGVIKKSLANDIVSYSFARDVFFKSLWNSIVCKARGLFIHKPSGKIVARSYEKFFNEGELPSTDLSVMEDKLWFPINAYKKENGFLGILSYDFTKDDFFIASKSTNQGPFAGWFKEIIKPYLTEELKTWLKECNCSLVFEVIDPVNDPHIIKYDKAEVILLDAINNTFKIDKITYPTLTELAAKFGFKVKELTYSIPDFQALKRFMENVKGIEHEGFVFEDQKGFMWKWKSPFYKKWKSMRTVLQRYTSGKSLTKSYVDIEEIQFTQFIQAYNPIEAEKLSVIKARELFVEAKQEYDKYLENIDNAQVGFPEFCKRIK